MFKKTLLVAALIAANLVAASAAKSAWALSPHNLPPQLLERAELVIELIRARAPTPEIGTEMVRVAACEVTGFAHRLPDGRLTHNVRKPGGYGVLQLIGRHLDAAERRGLRPRDNLDDYLEVAYSLVRARLRARQHPLSDWNMSRRCWHYAGEERVRSELAALRALDENGGHDEVAEARR